MIIIIIHYEYKETFSKILTINKNLFYSMTETWDHERGIITLLHFYP